MKTLQEFLSDRAEIERGKADEKKAVQSEWIWAVRRLIQQIREWLRDADREHLLKIDEELSKSGRRGQSSAALSKLGGTRKTRRSAGGRQPSRSLRAPLTLHETTRRPFRRR